MKGKRTDRIRELIKESLGQNILTKIRDPRLGFVTINSVEVSPDLQYARVYYTVLGDEKIRKSTEAALNQARGFLQKEIAHELKLRLTPILSFHYDTCIQHSMKIEAILKKIHEEEEKKKS